MLALAALTYRGIDRHSEVGIRADLEPWLGRIPPELGTWRLAWGPASFRVSISLVDDAMAYVARKVGGSTELPDWVVAIRGTNPVSWIDWVFGDFWVGHMVPWSDGASTTAKISASTWLGDRIIRSLAAEDPDHPTAGDVSPSHSSGLADKLTKLVADLDPAPLPIDPLRLVRSPETFNDSLIARIDDLRSARAIASVGDAFARIRARFEVATTAVHQSVLDKLHREILRAQDSDPGIGIQTFLHESVRTGERIAVTGHSKGGALTHTTALWLAETWAGADGVTIDCYSFAGPTCGNQDFVDHYHSKLGGRTRRIVNDLDLVPHAWHPDDLEHIASEYPRLEAAILGVRGATEKHAYRHLRRPDVRISRGHKKGAPDVADLIYQHLDAYLEEAELPADRWCAARIMR
jgi:hypothetical protein